ncbi:glycoside hydrolase family 2 TIM barrel-domain containing protein [Ochrovirga pacifica]|uniref:glycoside hydrolase family 2 TIM barrel-domain containing protein n=1 Tax=Ochrovirga pacifica TaxID=1042376 RepID=UPI00030FCAAB|nr:glycoside hydrolase family 2 TIM barrel-domain containing protein [Ochrovirga pacifica]
MRIVYLLVVCFFMTSSFGVAQNQTQKIYLSGTDKDHVVAWDFFCSDGRKSGEWTKIGVPSCWEQQGFGTYNYGSDKIEDRVNEYGLYKHSFFADKNWKNKDIKIVFEGVMTDAEVKVNGKLAGEVHQGAFYEFNYTITDLLQYGSNNLLEVKVNKASANESINHAERDADFWIFGGIYRPVYLTISPKNNIDRYAIDAKANGSIVADLFLDTKKADDVALTLLDVKGNKVQDLKVKDLKKEKSKFRVETKASAIKTWNPETPNLYQLKIDLLDKKGTILHSVTEKIGFRTVEVLEGDGIYVNGKRIKFKGVNRHAFHPESGRTTSKKISTEHVQLMKDMNMNAVRMSHYPPDKHFLEVCDSLGLFVIDEICTWHNPVLDTKVARKIVKETVVRDVNHPSVILWANGNEQGWNSEVDADFAQWDIQKREVIHPWSIYKKTNTIHYSHYHSLINDAYSQEKILFPTEFLHGLYDGGHGAGLEDYWNIMWNLPLSAGGFLWDFADEGIERTDKNNQIDLQGSKAADGIVGPYMEKEASYFAIKEIWSPIFIEKRYVTPDFNGMFRIENRYHYTNLKDCKLTASWLKFKEPKEAGHQILHKSKVQLPALQPGAKGELYIPKPQGWQQADALHLTATDVNGHEIFTWSYPVASPKKSNLEKVEYSNNGLVKTTSTDRIIAVTAGEYRYRFSKENGLLKEVKKGETLIPLTDGPIILNQKDKVQDIQITSLDNKTEILVIFEEKKWMPAWSTIKEKRSDVIKWTVHANGLLDLRVEFKGFRNLKGYRGITFSFPEKEVAGMQWLGDGPYRVWRNRTKGTRFQVWENDYNNTVTGQAGGEYEFVYPEFKGFFSNLYWSKVKGNHNNGFTVYCRTPHTYLRMLTPEEPKDNKKGAAKRKVHPAFPTGDISFVMNIPGMGTKFQFAESTGPHGNSEHYFGNDDEPIVMDLTFEF